MPQEIEDRYLILNPPSLNGLIPEKIVQGYLTPGGTGGPTVRVRTIDDQIGYLTVKGKKKAGAGSEFEYPIPIQDARDILVLCGKLTLTKDRYTFCGSDGRDWSLDVFTGRHQGLVIAEVELDYVGQPYIRMPWAGPDITNNKGLGNAAIARSDMAAVNKAIAACKSKAPLPPPKPPAP